MTLEQLNRGKQIIDRIGELEMIKEKIKWDKDDTKIDKYKIPKNSKEVIFALCQKEIDDLEKEFEAL